MGGVSCKVGFANPCGDEGPGRLQVNSELSATHRESVIPPDGSANPVRLNSLFPGHRSATLGNATPPTSRQGLASIAALSGARTGSPRRGLLRESRATQGGLRQALPMDFPLRDVVSTQRNPTREEHGFTAAGCADVEPPLGSRRYLS